MALAPIDEIHAAQIQAGTLGRKAGHAFEDRIVAEINALQFPFVAKTCPKTHVVRGDPALLLVEYIASALGYPVLQSALAISTGTLATSEEGRKWLSINGADVRRCKSDLVITLHDEDGRHETVGVSTKQCNNLTPTNAQLYFTTARGFSNLLRNNGLGVSDQAILAMRQFCGDTGFRPLDDAGVLAGRQTDPRRFFWEEINADGRAEWERLFCDQQDEITRLMLQKAYIDDPFIPTFLLHKTRASTDWTQTEIAVYSIDELVKHSRDYGGFSTKAYAVRKGSYRDPAGVTHSAPRFGIVQMQRGGQAQHPDQLQFNLEAGYFYKIQNSRPNMLGDGET
jgi:hypothetical protein